MYWEKLFLIDYIVILLRNCLPLNHLVFGENIQYLSKGSVQIRKSEIQWLPYDNINFLIKIVFADEYKTNIAMSVLPRRQEAL